MCISENQKRSACHMAVFAVPLFLSVWTQAQQKQTTFSPVHAHSGHTRALQASDQDSPTGAAVLREWAGEGAAPRHKGTHRTRVTESLQLPFLIWEPCDWTPHSTATPSARVLLCWTTRGGDASLCSFTKISCSIHGVSSFLMDMWLSGQHQCSSA